MVYYQNHITVQNQNRVVEKTEFLFSQEPFSDFELLYGSGNKPQGFFLGGHFSPEIIISQHEVLILKCNALLVIKHIIMLI